ncbi:FAD-dependent oxidoreductase [Glaciecola sp. MF2-115]|uniref:FAD-dependent oxidoreductase n=1 Tax=Glaciecola sp. MF2-115 TaxID=3384827 RepID=UPI00399FD63E
MLKKQNYDIVIVGAGFYGCSIAVELLKQGRTVAILEKESDIMQRASYTNQARIHQGYHYPRSILTALRSQTNFDKFITEFSGCVYDQFDKYYAIAKTSSKVNAEQFRQFCNRINAPIEKAPKNVSALFNPNLIEQVFKVREYAFDALKLKNILLNLLEQQKVDVGLACEVMKVKQSSKGLSLNYTQLGEENSLETRYVLNCTYSGINQLNQASEIPIVPLKHELTEMALMQMPDELEKSGFTVMDGPFFSIMPFPARGLHSLSHVRYTPHCFWLDDSDKKFVDTKQFIKNHAYVNQQKVKSYHVHMLNDAQRYLPALRECKYVDSIWEIKTILPQSEIDDSRPILFKRNQKLANVVSVMGGKIDNIFDIRDKLNELLDDEWSAP